MTQYESLPDLRADLTSDDPDTRAEAYGAVLNADLEVSSVLSTEPPRDDLVKAGVIPEPETDPDAPPASQLRQKQVQLLEEIRDAVTTEQSSTKTQTEGK